MGACLDEHPSAHSRGVDLQTTQTGGHVIVCGYKGKPVLGGLGNHINTYRTVRVS